MTALPYLLGAAREKEQEDPTSGSLCVYLDFETHSALDLELVGARMYAEHPSTGVLLLAYAIGDDPVQVWRPAVNDNEPLPADLYRAISANCRVVAHNYSFDRAIWAEKMPLYGAPDIPIGQWDCTAFRARLARLPSSLEEAARALGLAVQKDAAGRRFMYSLIRRDLQAVPLTDAECDRLSDYARQDVEVLRALDRRLPEMPDEWRTIFELDAAMNAAGMPVDLATVEKLVIVRDAENRRLAQEFRQLVNGELSSPKQVARLRDRLCALGVDLQDLRRETLENWIEKNPRRHDLAAELIRNRLGSAHSSDAKLDRIVATAGTTSRVRDGLVLHGAHTGRWAGNGVQLQNLPKSVVDEPEAMLKALINRADEITIGTIDPMQEPGWSVSVKEAIAGCLRGCFKAPEGWVFVSADLGQIESRVLCWIAGQKDKLDLYRRGEDIYVAEAKGLNSNNRDLGKLLVLSAGYGASGNVVHTRAPGFGVALTCEEAHEFTARWREANLAIVEFWQDLFRHLQLCVELPADQPPIEFRCFDIWRTAETLFVQLPSGRCLKYRDPVLEIGEYGSLQLTVQLPKHKKMLPVSLWHGAATENVVQAIAADLLMAAMLRLHQDGIFLVGCIHDEIVALAPVEHAEAIKEHMIAVMKTPPEWAPDLPLAADAFINTRFIKPARPKHALLPPSVAERWMNCPGSVAAEKAVGPQPESPFAAAGTEAHKIFAECLERGTGPNGLDDPYQCMAIDHALELARQVIAGRKFKVETRLEPLPGLGKVWGTADIMVFDAYDRIVAIVDFKFGVGVAVEADSLQVRIYGLLAAQQYGCPIDGIDLHIIQPRSAHPLGPHRVHRFSTEAMNNLFTALQEAVQATEDPAAPRTAGEHCQFCGARKTCPERQSYETRKRGFANAFTR
jgi:DNA polymerase